MKKLAILLFSLAFASNAFAMLTKKFLNYKNIRSFHTNTKTYSVAPDHCECFAQDCTCGEKNSSNERIIFASIDFKNSGDKTNDLLHTIIEQNKENKDLLCAILKQNNLHFSIQRNSQFKMPTAKHYGKLAALYKELENKYDIGKINPNE